MAIMRGAVASIDGKARKRTGRERGSTPRPSTSKALREGRVYSRSVTADSLDSKPGAEGSTPSERAIPCSCTTPCPYEAEAKACMSCHCHVSSEAEQPPVEGKVAGSTPARGAKPSDYPEQVIPSIWSSNLDVSRFYEAILGTEWHPEHLDYCYECGAPLGDS